MQNTFHSEPTEKDNPYASNPYSIPPPPPPKKKSIRHIVNISLIVFLCLVSGILAMLYVTKPETSTGSAIVYVTPEPPPYQYGLGAQSPITTPAPDPPLPTAPPPQPTTAYSLYQNIIKNLDSNHRISMKGYDTKWSGWPYTPERNAILFTDTTPGGTYTVEIAVFNSPKEAQADYQCQRDNKCSKLSYQGSSLQGAYNGACLYMDNNYNGNGSQYADYMVDDHMAFNSAPC